MEIRKVDGVQYVVLKVCYLCTSGSVVEYRLAKARVAGSNPVSCSLVNSGKPLNVRASRFFLYFFFGMTTTDYTAMSIIKVQTAFIFLNRRNVVMYNVLDIAKYIIWYCKEKRYSISNLKLQKVLYFVQADFLVSVGTPCFEEEIEAWDFGPVVPEVYHEFKIFGSADIPKSVCVNADKAILKKDKAIINNMVDQCGAYSVSALVEITHNQDPWLNTHKRYCKEVIEKETIKQYFEED